MAEEPGQEKRDAPNNEDKLPRSRLIGFAIAGAILVVVILWVWVRPSDPTEKKDFIQAVGVLLAALAGLGGLYFTAQNLKQTRENAESQLNQARDSTAKQLEQARDSTAKQLEQARESQERTQALTEQGQITERFTRAIDQLGASYDDGNPRIEIRLGGIYALERIAWDSPKRDYSTVMEVLTAYVRENAPRAPGSSEGSYGLVEQAASPERLRPTADIQATLDVLRRAQTRVPEEDRTRLDLHEAYLRRANLQGADLRGANLQQVDLREANLQGAQLQGAKLLGAQLQRAHLQRAHLEGADLRRAHLEGANLEGANPQGADLRGARVTDEQLADTQSLQGAKMPDGSERP